MSGATQVTGYITLATYNDPIPLDTAVPIDSILVEDDSMLTRPETVSHTNFVPVYTNFSVPYHNPKPPIKTGARTGRAKNLIIHIEVLSLSLDFQKIVVKNHHLHPAKPYRSTKVDFQLFSVWNIFGIFGILACIRILFVYTANESTTSI